MKLIDFQKPNKQMSYFLGFLWGDGHISKQNNSITIEIITSDFKELEPLFDKIGDFHHYNRKRIRRQPQSSIQFSDKTISNYLKSLNYSHKEASHQTIIEHIPKKYQYLWVRGLFDADGCVYRYDKEYLRQISISSNFHQDWTYLQELLEQNNIHTKIEQKIYKTNKSSNIRGSGTQNVVNLYNYLYPNGYDNIGLTRKHDKMFGIVKDFT